MRKTAKILLLVATLWPAVYVVVFMSAIFGIVFFGALHSPHTGTTPHGSSEAPPGMVYGFFGLMVLHILTMFWMMGLLVFYIIDVFRNPRLQSDYRVLWALVIFFGGVVGMPVYWYLNIWREQPLPSP